MSREGTGGQGDGGGPGESWESVVDGIPSLYIPPPLLSFCGRGGWRLTSARRVVTVARRHTLPSTSSRDEPIGLQKVEGPQWVILSFSY